MQQRKKKKYYGKVRAKKLSSSKYINKRKTCYLEIQGNTITCTAPVVEIGIPKRINGRCVRKIGAYRIIGKSKASGWEIVKISSSFKTPNSLINSKILVTDGKKVVKGTIVKASIVKGTIVKASIVGGGATSPATEDGLPPVDE